MEAYFDSGAETLKRKIRILLLFVMTGLVVSGVTAFPLEGELYLLKEILLRGSIANTALSQWIVKVYDAIKETNFKYPFIAYGTDWLAFAHLAIAVAFIGPLRDPVRNVWVVHFGVICCIGVVPLAFIAGAIRGIPVYWQLVDCSFGVAGIVPLLLCLKYIKQIEQGESTFPHLKPMKKRLDLDEAKIFDF